MNRYVNLGQILRTCNEPSSRSLVRGGQESESPLSSLPYNPLQCVLEERGPFDTPYELELFPASTSQTGPR